MNNLLNQLQLVKLSANEDKALSDELLEVFEQILAEDASLMSRLSALQHISENAIAESVKSVNLS